MTVVFFSASPERRWSNHFIAFDLEALDRPEAKVLAVLPSDFLNLYSAYYAHFTLAHRANPQINLPGSDPGQAHIFGSKL